MNTEQKVVKWAEARNIIAGATPQAQMLKLTEEMGELAGGIARGKTEVISDSIGDCAVVLTILAAQFGMSLESCFAAAYEEIKDRKGKMVGGVFIKETDL